MNKSVLKEVLDIPEGYSEGIYNNHKSFKIYAKELTANDFISLNYYRTTRKDLLRPCEMPEQKVIDFLKNITIIKNE